MLVEQSLQAGEPGRAAEIIERAKDDYSSNSAVLYDMDRGMTLHLAGRYDASNAVLEQAETEIDHLYTRRIRTEAKAFLVNDTLLPFEGDPYEQVMVNVVKALNYALMGQINEALVEARRIDHRLNLLADQTADREAYRDDGFARYVTGLLYEAAGDLNDAFIAYRKAYEGYQGARAWLHVGAPAMLHKDLLRTSEALGFTTEFEQYRQAFPNAAWMPATETGQLAQLVVISYNGRAPHKEDRFVDLPVSMDALKLVVLTKAYMGRSSQQNRAAESVLYGLNGRVVRVAVPALVPQKTTVAHSQVSLTGPGASVTASTELAQNVTALAEKNLGDQFSRVAVKAVARAAVKFALAEGVGRTAQAAAGRDAGPIVGLLASLIAKSVAVGTEEADKRSWRTLPDEIQIARLWVPEGTYTMDVRPVDRTGQPRRAVSKQVTLYAGVTTFVTQRVLP